MTPNKKPSSSENKNISISGDVRDSNVFIGDNNTFIKKIFNIFKSDSETLEHRNRRILLGHVDNAWIKGVLDASLHGVALLDLGIKQDPEAVTKYPWAIKKESNDETLPAGTSMLEIFDNIGMGRSLLILGAPGSGKTTMLLELARGLIARAREDATQPIPMVFNLASWTEKLTLSDWLAQELNNLYSVPRKTAPDWIKGDKLLLLLDGLDEVRQESRAKCVEAINAFRKEHGMTSLAVCSRSQDYADLNAKLSFEGAIEVQPLTQKQIAEFFNRFGDEIAGIRRVLQKDSALREMTVTPLFLSIMIMAYRAKRDVDILVSQDEKAQRKHLFDTYIERMFEHPRSKNISFKKQDVLRWLSWLASKMIEYNEVPYFLENMQPVWFIPKNHLPYRFSDARLGKRYNSWIGFIKQSKVSTVDSLSFNWTGIRNLLIVDLIAGVFFGVFGVMRSGLVSGLVSGLFEGLGFGMMLVFWLVMINANLNETTLRIPALSKFVRLLTVLSVKQLDQITVPGQRLVLTAKNSLFSGLISGLVVELSIVSFGLIVSSPFISEMSCAGGMVGFFVGLTFWQFYGGRALLNHYSLRRILARKNLLPWRLVPFLDHCVDLIFLRRVGGGYIFVHRLLMEHFAEMYVETPTSKGN